MVLLLNVKQEKNKNNLNNSNLLLSLINKKEYEFFLFQPKNKNNPLNLVRNPNIFFDT